MEEYEKRLIESQIDLMVISTPELSFLVPTIIEKHNDIDFWESIG